jgi:hypothetical protein
MTRKNVAVGVRLTSETRERIRRFVTGLRSEHATILALLELGLEEAEKDPSLMYPDRVKPFDGPRGFLAYLGRLLLGVAYPAK